MDKSIKITAALHKMISEAAKKERRSRKTIMELAMEAYVKRINGNGK